MEEANSPERTHRSPTKESDLSAAATQLRTRVAVSAASERDTRRAARAIVVFTVIAVATAFCLLALPSERRDYREILTAALLGVVLIAVALLSSRFPRVAPLAISLGYVALAALLRDAAGGSVSGFGGLYLLPVLWLALTAGGVELAAVLIAILVAQVVPMIAVGAPWYPSSSGRGVIVFTSVAALAGLMVNRLVTETRGRAELLQRQTTQLEDHNEQLLELDRMKDEFIAVISHELRTPLTSIRGYLEMALDEADDPIPATQRSHLSIVQRNVNRLVALVDQLLFLARAEAHGLAVSKQPIDLPTLIQEAADTARPTAEARSIDLYVETEQMPSVLADRDGILRVLDNLVSNAVKFTPPGGEVRLQARRAGDQILVEVTDTGPGIQPGDERHLFKPFARTDSAAANAVPGTGLGLAISQAIAHSHNTTIEVDSTPGTRTTFRLALPLS